MLREDMKVIKGGAVQILGAFGDLVSVVHHCCAVHDWGILEKSKEDPGRDRRSILKETQTPRT